jgi:hypothetical protein
MKNKSNDFHGELTTIVESAARTADGNSGAIEVGDWQKGLFVLNITASATEAGDTLNVMIDMSYDNGVTWVTAARFTEQAGNGAANVEILQLGADNPTTSVVSGIQSDPASATVRPIMVSPIIRIRWEIADVATLLNQSHTFSVDALLF